MTGEIIDEPQHGMKPRIALFFILLFLLVTPILSHAGGLGFAPAVTVLGIVGYLLIGFGIFSFIRENKFEFIWLWPLALFLIWIFASAFWSPYRSDIWPMNAGKFVIGILGFLGVYFIPGFISEEKNTYVRHAIIACGMLIAALLAFDFLSGFALTYLFDPLSPGELRQAKNGDAIMNLSHSVTVLLLFNPIVMVMALKVFDDGRTVAILWLLVLCLVIWLSGLSISALALLVSLFFMFLAAKWPKLGLRTVIIFVAMSILLAPLWSSLMHIVPDSVKNTLPLSWEHRINMWGYAYTKIMEHPIIGHGFDAARTFGDTFEATRWKNMPLMSLHPHNFGLQIWIETGLIGAVLSALILLLLLPVIELFASTGRYRAAALGGVLGAIFCITNVTYGVWQEWWWGIMIACTMLLSFIPTDESTENSTTVETY